MASRSRIRWQRLIGGGLAALLLVAAVLVGPRIIDGHAALAWTRHFAGRDDPGRQSDAARQAARWAARALQRSAPLPYAGEATRLAIEAARRLEASDPDVALQVSIEVRGALDGLAAWRRIGLGRLAEEVRSLTERTRSRAVPASPGS